MKDFVAHTVIFGAMVYIVYPSTIALYSAVVCFSFAQSLCFWLQGQKKGWRRENGLRNPFSFNSFLVLWLSRGRFFISRSQGDGISSIDSSRDAQSHLTKSVLFGVLVNIGIAKLLLQCAIYWPHSVVMFTWFASMQLACALISLVPLPGSPGFGLISPWLSSRMVDFLQQEFCQLALCVFCALLSHQVPLIEIVNTATATLGVISFSAMYSALGLGGLVLLDGVPELRLSKRLDDVGIGKYMPFDSEYFSKSKKQKSESRKKDNQPSIKDRIVQMVPRVFK